MTSEPLTPEALEAEPPAGPPSSIDAASSGPAPLSNAVGDSASSIAPGRSATSGFLARNLLRAAVYWAAAMVVTWPLIFHLPDKLLGHPDVDVWNHIWGFWWVKQKLIDHGVLPLVTHELAWPRGGRLYYIDPLNALLSIPLQLVFDLAVSFNLTLLGELALVGFASHLAAREAGASERGSYLAGLLVCTSPILRCELHNGITEVINIGWLALSVTASHRAFRTGRLRDAALAGLLMALAFVACWYYGLAAGGVGVMLWAMRTDWRPLTRSRVWTHLKDLVVAGICCAAVAVPFAVAFSWTLQGTESIIRRSPGISRFLIRHNATDLLSFFMPGDYHRPDIWKDYGERFLHTTYLGYAGLALGLAGLTDRGRRPWLWALIGLAFAVLALGPYLYVGGDFFTIGGRRVRLPFKIVFEGLGLMAITHPGRMVVVTLICLGVLAALGHDRLEARFGAIARVFLPIGAASMLFETLLLGPAPWPLTLASATLGPCTELLAKDPIPGAVLDLPGYHHLTMRPSQYLYAQTQHRRPVPYIVDVRVNAVPGLDGRFFYRHIVALAERDRRAPGGDPPRLARYTYSGTADELRYEAEQQFATQNYRFIVLHRELSEGFDIWPYRRLLTQALGEPVSTPDGCWIYALGPKPGTAPAGGK